MVNKLEPGLKGELFVNKNTAFVVEKYNPKDLIEKEIGDSKVPDKFIPQQKVMRWDNEVNFSVRLVHDEKTPDVVIEGDSVVWKGKKVEAKFYDVFNEEHPEGAGEFEIVLKEKPATNIVEFSLNTKGLDFFYQPALTPEEISEGAERPENVVGSYAVYHSTKGGMNDAAGMEYKTGKVGHIFRPQVEDANGIKVWGELNVDTEKGILSVTIPQDFLDNAVYPVRHAAGLTFGYTTAGGTQLTGLVQDGVYLGSIVGTRTSNSGDTITSFSFYGGGVDSQTIQMAAFLYSGGVLSTQLGANGVTVVVNSTTGQWWTTSTVSQAMSAGSAYGIGWDATISTSPYCTLNYDNGSAPGRFNSTLTAFPGAGGNFSPTGTDSGRHYSIYATYTASGTFPVVESVTETDFATSVTSMAVNMPATVNAGDRLIALCHVRNAGTWSTVPTGWTNLAEQAGGAAVGELSIFEKIADGTEDGGTATWVTGTGTSAAWQVICISGAHASTASEVTTASGDSSSANPPSETASWGGSENNLWLAVAGHSAISASAFSAAPAGFFGFSQNGASSGGAAVCVAHGYDMSATDTYDPGTFTPSGSNRYWAAATIAVRSAETGGGGSAAPTLMLMGLGI